MTAERAAVPQPRLGIQGSVVAWLDPWAGEASDDIMRTGTGVVIASQDPPPSPAQFLATLADLDADFYVHHVVPGHVSNQRLADDIAAGEIDIVLGNEYGNINGPFREETNRYDLPVDLVRRFAETGRLAGVLYDEPEHLQINADQYRKDAHLPHFGDTTGADAPAAAGIVESAVRGIRADVDAAVSAAGAATVPVLAEQVFPVLFHTLARGGMTPTPKVMKESFQPLQLSTAIGAAVQYARDLWICADLWGPDVGPWFTRAPGFPGHSPQEFASALRMAYLFAPSHLFVENVDVLLQHRGGGEFARTEYGEVWREFVRDFVPAHRLAWRFADARPSIAIVHAEDSNFGRDTLPFGDRERTAPVASRTLFDAWHLLSHGSIPREGSCMHIPVYDFPRHRLNAIPRAEFPLPEGAPLAREATRTHPLFHASNNVLVFDEFVTRERLTGVEFVLAVGSRMPEDTVRAMRGAAEAGATVVIGDWLVPAGLRASARFPSGGVWAVCESLFDDDALETVQRFRGPADTWRQRFGDTDLIITAADSDGTTLNFDIVTSRIG